MTELSHQAVERYVAAVDAARPEEGTGWATLPRVLTGLVPEYSPRLLRNFMRDAAPRSCSTSLSAPLPTATAGLYTVGVQRSGGQAFVPRLAVSGSLGSRWPAWGCSSTSSTTWPTPSRSTPS